MGEVNGFEIELRELTEEEKTRKVTWERFREFHYAAGEDFLDTTGEGNVQIFAGWLLHKYPELSGDILNTVNGHYSEVKSFSAIEEFGYDEDKDIYNLYEEFAEFCNQTGALRERVNQVLIQVTEYYNQ
ncbi:MAG: hypothetical protein GY928_04055 [Colwellia sp.]|nr:hypothetical protein [Colwellia sp.]